MRCEISRQTWFRTGDSCHMHVIVFAVPAQGRTITTRLANLHFDRHGRWLLLNSFMDGVALVHLLLVSRPLVLSPYAGIAGTQFGGASPGKHLVPTRFIAEPIIVLTGEFSYFFQHATETDSLARQQVRHNHWKTLLSELTCQREMCQA